MDDLTWLAGRTLAFAADAPLIDLPHPAPRAVVADPTRVQAYVARGLRVVAVAGYPTGRHHTLVKAAEARLAVQSGAGEVWVCVDPLVTDENALLADLVAMRDACPAPARMGVILPGALRGLAGAASSSTAGTASTAGTGRVADLAAQAGYDLLVVAPVGTEEKHEWPLEAVALVPGATTDEVIVQLDAGASGVAV